MYLIGVLALFQLVNNVQALWIVEAEYAQVIMIEA